MIEKSLMVGDFKLIYYELGQGQPLIFLHGWGSQPKAYSRTIKELSQRFRVIAPCLLGHGLSSSVPDKFSFTEFSELAYQFIKKLNLTDIILVGHSLGGAIAVFIAQKDPSLIKKLFLVDSTGLSVKRSKHKWRRLWIKKALFNLKYRPGYQQLFKFITHNSKNLVNAKRTAKLTKGLDLENMLQYVSVPTVLLWGQKDFFFSEEYANRFQQKIPNSRLIIIPGQGHDWCLVRPKLFNKVIKENV